MSKVERPALHIAEQEQFSPTEVGISHQFTNAFVRCLDNGDVELVAGEGLAIVLHAQNRSITFIADKVRFITREEGGLRWNQQVFNPKANKFTEPALLDQEPEDGSGIFRGLDDFLDEV